MSKRRVSKQQLERIKQLQAERQARARIKTAEIEQDIKAGKLGSEQTGLLVTHYGKYADVETKEQQLYRCNLRQHLGTNVVGDKVIFRAGEKNTGVIVAVSPRTSLLWRLDDRGREKSIAANIQQMIIVIAPEPEPTSLLIDSYLIAAETLKIKPILLFNKIDLLKKQFEFHGLINTYQQLGYASIHASTITNHGLDELVENLKNKTSVFVGQSGVGKSSLINALLPDVDLQIGELHEASKLGKHTTTTAKLYHLPHGGELIDSPGIREFNLWEMQPQDIAKGFIEFQPYLGQCKFRNCRHLKEPECAVLDAVKQGKISDIRWQSYQRLLS